MDAISWVERIKVKSVYQTYTYSRYTLRDDSHSALAAAAEEA